MADPFEQSNGRERHVATSMLSLAGGEVLGKVMMLVTLAWSARVIGVAAFGVLTFGMGLGALLSTIPSLAPSARMIQLVGRNVETLGVRLAALNVLRWVFTIPAIALAVPFVLARESAVDRWTITLMIAATVLDNTAKVWLSACTVLDRQSATAAVIVCQRAATLVLVGIALLTVPSSASVAMAFTGGALLSHTAMFMVARHYGARLDYRGMRWSHLREMLVAVPVIGGSSLFTEALARIDVVLIGLLAGDAAVGIYGAAYRLMETALFVSWTLGRSLTPDLVRAQGRDELARPVRLGTVVLISLYLPYGVALALCGQELVTLVFGAGYEIGAVLVLLSPAPLFFGIAHFGGVALFARRPAPIVLIATVSAVVTNVVLSLVLLPVIQAEGAALAKTAALAVEAAIVGVAIMRLAPPRGAGRGILVALVATLLASVPMLLSLPVIPAVVSAAVIYCVSWYLLVCRFDRESAEWIAAARGKRP